MRNILIYCGKNVKKDYEGVGMLNREDIRKVIEAYERVRSTFKEEGKDLNDATMRAIQEAVLGEMKKKEEADKYRKE